MKNIALSVLCIGAFLIIAAAGRKPIYVETNTAIQRGQNVSAADGTCTNTFATLFSAAPNVVVSQFGNVVSATNTVQSITKSNFIYFAGDASVSNQWIAIGLPK